MISPPARILCPVDFSAPSAQALAAVELGAVVRRRCHHATRPSDAGPSHDDWPVCRAGGPPHRRRHPPTSRIVSCSSTMRARPCSAISDAIRHATPFEEQVLLGRPDAAILHLAEQRHAGLIAMGVRGRSAVDLAVFGSTIQRVVRRALCPVLAVHPEPAEASGADPS